MRDSSMFYFNISINYCPGCKYSPHPYCPGCKYSPHPYCPGCKYSPHPWLVLGARIQPRSWRDQNRQRIRTFWAGVLRTCSDVPRMARCRGYLAHSQSHFSAKCSAADNRKTGKAFAEAGNCAGNCIVAAQA